MVATLAVVSVGTAGGLATAIPLLKILLQLANNVLGAGIGTAGGGGGGEEQSSDVLRTESGPAPDVPKEMECGCIL